VAMGVVGTVDVGMADTETVDERTIYSERPDVGMVSKGMGIWERRIREQAVKELRI